MPIGPSTPRGAPIKRFLRLLSKVDGSPKGLMYLTPELLDLLREVLLLHFARRARGRRQVGGDCLASHLVFGPSLAVGDVI